MLQTKEVIYTNRHSTAVRRRRRHRQRIRRIKKLGLCMIGVFFICAVSGMIGQSEQQDWKRLVSKKENKAEQAVQFVEEQKEKVDEYPRELLEMLEKNPETYDFVTNYPKRKQYLNKKIDLSGEVKSGEVPLFLQWDRRWGYNSYGNEMIAVAGCGPTCMSMAYVYLTKDTSMNPRKMAAFAHDNGYDTQVGTSWSFFTDGAAQLDLQGVEIGLDEAKMKEVLDEGKVIICSMRPGDFTTTGHFILIRGYEGDKFWVNDPNSKENSGKCWTYDTLYPQIKCLWSIGD